MAKVVRDQPVLERDRHRFFVTIGKRTYCIEPHMWIVALQEGGRLYAEFEAENGAEVIKLGERGPMFLRETGDD